MRTNMPGMPNQDTLRLFEPDTLAPEQFYATLRRNQFVDPERRLMAAILEDAVSCLSRDPRQCPGRQRKYFHEAHSWINSNEEKDWIFSFTSVCESLGLNPTYLRHGLNRWSALTGASATPRLRLKKYRSGARRRKLRLRTAL